MLYSLFDMGGYAGKLQSAREANAQTGSLAGKQGIVFGGTAGIGQAFAERMAAAGASVTIVGRSEPAAQKILEGIRATREAKSGNHSAGATYEFIQADLMLLGNGRQAVRKYLDGPQGSRCDFVVFCQTKATLQGLTLTKEGIDEKLALNFYSRVFLTKELMPLLERTAQQPGADVRVLSVLSAGVHKPYANFKDDPYLTEGSYSQTNAADVTSFYTDLWIDDYAKRHPSVTFVHAAPGFVATSWGTDMPAVVRGPIRCMQAVGGRRAEECVELIGQGLWAPSLRGGHRHIDQYGQPTTVTSLHNDENVAIVSAATEKLLRQAEAKF